MSTQRRTATEAEAKALASALRIRILRVCLDEPLTNKQIAARLDLHPATVLHHVRKLVATGFLEPQGERRGARGAREIPYLATGKSWTLDLREYQRPGDYAMVEAFRQELALVPDPDEVIMSRLGVRLTKPEYEELLRRLTDLTEELAARPRPGHGRAYSFFVALHPDVTRDTTRAEQRSLDLIAERELGTGGPLGCGRDDLPEP